MRNRGNGAPSPPELGKVGVDDFLAAGHTLGDLEGLLVSPSELVGRDLLDIGDFVAHLPSGQYIHVPTGEEWVGKGIDAAFSKVRIGTDDKGEPIMAKASDWLSTNAPVHGRTWSPGEARIIEGKALRDGGWVPVPAFRVLNSYEPPDPAATHGGKASEAGPWVEHLERLWGEEGRRHLVPWFAARVQRPQEKVNHAVVLGGAPGIGKDFIVDAVIPALGPWNVQEVSPSVVMGRFNGFLQAVLLRVSELRDLGEADRFKLYDHMKVILSDPPQTLRIDEKHVTAYKIPNLVGVVYTTNYKEDGIFLAKDDRRHYVLWSRATLASLGGDEYFARLWDWLVLEGGYAHVGAYLREFDLGGSGFDRNAPPPKTSDFWDVVMRHQSQELGEFLDLLDGLGNPDVVTISELRSAAEAGATVEGGKITVTFGSGLAEWLNNRGNAAKVPHRMRECGYEAVRNPWAEDGLWYIRKRRQVAYVRSDRSLTNPVQAVKDTYGV